MAFKKGQSGNPKGKLPGTKSEKVIQWEELGHALLTRHSERANQVLATMDDDKFLEHYGKLLEYFKPKQSRAVVQQDGVVQHEVIVTRK